MLNRSYTPYLLMGALAFVITTGCQAQDNTDEPYQTFKAFNNIVIPYAVYLPEEFDPDRAYPAVLAFPSGEMGRDDADEMTEHMWSTPASRGEWIVVVPLVPGDDWRTHPNHHALNDLLDHIKDHYPIHNDKFHIMGYGRLGSDIASTWSHMSREYFSSLTTASGAPYRRWDEDDLQNLPTEDGERLDVLMIFGDEDETTTSDVEKAKARMNRIGLPYRVEVVAADNVALETLSNGGLLKIMASRLLHFIVIPYAVYLPEEFDPDRAYPAVLAFPSGEMGRDDADEMTEHMWSTPASRGEWIVVVPLVPGDDWRTHPNHHALNDLLDHIKDHYPIHNDKFHIMGYGRLGSDIASTWSHMSREYFSSLTTASGAPYRRWDEDDLQNLPTEDGERLDVLMIFGDEDETTTSDVEKAKARMNRIGLPYRVEVVAADNVALETLSNGGLLKIMASRLLPH